MHLFYKEEISIPEVVLIPEEARHALGALRLAEGDPLALTDGKGNYYKGRITEAIGTHCRIQILSHQTGFGKRNYQLHLFIAPTKSIDRFEWFLEKAVEIGLDEVTPLLCDHSERKKIRNDRLERLIIASMKQSQKAYKPVLHELTPFSAAIQNMQEDNAFIAHCQPDFPRESLTGKDTRKKRTAVFIGPEGDFSPEEIKQAHAAGITGIHMGSSRLRTETAGVAACHTLYLLNELL